jgi:ribonuclease Z
MPALALAMLLAIATASPAFAQQDSTRILRVTFLGTSGGPVAGPALAGSAAFVQYGREGILIDIGRGATQQLQRINGNFGAIGRIFITHLHSDHTVGLPELWLARWTRARLAPPLEVFGPAGTRDMIAHIREAWKYDVDIRSGPPESNPRASTEMTGRDVADGMTFERNGMKVTVIRVDHGPVLAYGYRIDAGGHSIAFSGDDIAAENLIERARGVDVMVHNFTGFTAAQLADTGRGGEVRRAAVKMLAEPEQAGTVFARVAPRLAVVTHFNRAPEFIARLRTTYAGPLQEADDLLRISIGDSIVVEQPPVGRPAVVPPVVPPRP